MCGATPTTHERAIVIERLPGAWILVAAEHDKVTDATVDLPLNTPTCRQVGEPSLPVGRLEVREARQAQANSIGKDWEPILLRGEDRHHHYPDTAVPFPS